MGNIKKYIIKTNGSVNSKYGMSVFIISLDGRYIGKTNIIDFNNALLLSKDLNEFLKKEKTRLNKNNCVYQYGLVINKRERKQGWGTKLKKECHKIIKYLGYSYVINIVGIINFGSQKIMNNLGYIKIKSNGKKDLLCKKL